LQKEFSGYFKKSALLLLSAVPEQEIRTKTGADAKPEKVSDSPFFLFIRNSAPPSERSSASRVS
jgi:hypothetical protein